MLSTTIRRWHSYIGLFIAPSVIFFALTGAIQLYGLHEANGHYRPPAIVEKLSSLHKDQVFAFGHHHEPPAPKDDDDDKEETSTLILKGFFLVVALGLTFSSAFGAWMGLTQLRRPRLASGLLISGALIPVILVIF
jgi:hypothetical protein